MCSVNNLSQRLLLIYIVLTLYACKKFVEIEPPTTSLVTTSVFEKNSTATAALLSIYAQMQAYPASLNLQTGISSDELKNYTSNLTATNLYANALNANDAGNVGIWSVGFNFIYQANAILEALPNSPNVTSAVKSQLTGESKFIRAFWNFYLMNLYGDIPIITGTDYKTNSSLSRYPTSQVYQQIISDLTDAQSLLNNNYVDATDTAITSERIRPSKWAATALLARVYLYTGDWKNAENAATLIINNTTLYKLTSLDSSFLKNNNEAIWQLQPNSNNKYTAEGSAFIITSNPLTSNSFVSVSNQLLNAFENGDNRRVKWIGSYTTTTPAATYYFPYKYKAGIPSTTPLTESSMVFRLAEQYLIRAEARAQQSNIPDAATDLNKVRNRAGLKDTTASTKVDLLTLIAHERQVELFTEGFRWFDLKRTNTIDQVMNVVTPQKGGNWKSYQQLYPIPVTDIQNSAGIITQNSGY